MHLSSWRPEWKREIPAGKAPQGSTLQCFSTLSIPASTTWSKNQLLTSWSWCLTQLKSVEMEKLNLKSLTWSQISPSILVYYDSYFTRITWQNLIYVRNKAVNWQWKNTQNQLYEMCTISITHGKLHWIISTELGSFWISLVCWGTVEVQSKYRSLWPKILL